MEILVVVLVVFPWIMVNLVIAFSMNYGKYLCVSVALYIKYVKLKGDDPIIKKTHPKKR
jgi:hypothetical protein